MPSRRIDFQYPDGGQVEPRRQFIEENAGLVRTWIFRPAREPFQRRCPAAFQPGFLIKANGRGANRRR